MVAKVLPSGPPGGSLDVKRVGPVTSVKMAVDIQQRDAFVCLIHYVRIK